MEHQIKGNQLLNKAMTAAAQTLKKYFNAMPDKENEEEIIKSISAGVSFHGATLWVLVFAIFIASLGLNVNSTAVIIGAMLISPLMGPIIGNGTCGRYQRHTVAQTVGQKLPCGHRHQRHHRHA